MSVQKGSAGGCCDWNRVSVDENFGGEYCKTTMHLEKDGEIKNHPLFQVIFGFIMKIDITKVNTQYEIKPISKLNNEKVEGKKVKKLL